MSPNEEPLVIAGLVRDLDFLQAGCASKPNQQCQGTQDHHIGAYAKFGDRGFSRFDVSRGKTQYTDIQTDIQTDRQGAVHILYNRKCQFL